MREGAWFKLDGSFASSNQKLVLVAIVVVKECCNTFASVVEVEIKKFGSP